MYNFIVTLFTGEQLCIDNQATTFRKEVFLKTITNVKSSL